MTSNQEVEVISIKKAFPTQSYISLLHGHLPAILEDPQKNFQQVRLLKGQAKLASTSTLAAVAAHPAYQQPIRIGLSKDPWSQPHSPSYTVITITSIRNDNIWTSFFVIQATESSTSKQLKLVPKWRELLPELNFKIVFSFEWFQPQSMPPIPLSERGQSVDKNIIYQAAMSILRNHLKEAKSAVQSCLPCSSWPSP